MKKLATILMLIAAILVGGMTIEAKTTSKKKTTAKTSTSRKISSVPTIKTFCKSFSESGFRSGYTYKGDDVVVKALKNLGFSVSSRKEKRRAEICGEMESWVSTVYTCTGSTSSGTIKIVLDPGPLMVAANITFPSAKDAQKFVDSATAIGYYLENTSNGTKYYSNPSDCYYYGANLELNGNTVKIIYLSEC